MIEPLPTMEIPRAANLAPARRTVRPEIASPRCHAEWTLVIRPKTGWLDLHLADLWRYRDLVALFVRRDFLAQYKQTILGPLWFVIQPILTTLTFTVVFGNVAKLSTDGLPKILFYLSGVTAWNYFAECLTLTSNTFVANANLFGKVYFPRLAIPVSIVISSLIKFGIQLGLLFCFLAYYVVKGSQALPTTALLLLPILLLLMASLGLGVGIIVSALTTKYRDLRFLIQFGVQLLMYTTPVIMPLSKVFGKYRWLMLSNPMTSVIETFRYGLLGSGTFSWSQLGFAATAAGLILTAGVLLFNHVEKTFMDTV
jgi:lipopolysaccharide transport system permease protein